MSKQDMLLTYNLHMEISHGAMSFTGNEVKKRKFPYIYNAHHYINQPGRIILRIRSLMYQSLWIYKYIAENLYGVK